jgi:hypothetical protein
MARTSGVVRYHERCGAVGVDRVKLSNSILAYWAVSKTSVELTVTWRNL